MAVFHGYKRYSVNMCSCKVLVQGGLQSNFSTAESFGAEVCSVHNSPI